MCIGASRDNIWTAKALLLFLPVCRHPLPRTMVMLAICDGLT